MANNLASTLSPPAVCGGCENAQPHAWKLNMQILHPKCGNCDDCKVRKMCDVAPKQRTYAWECSSCGTSTPVDLATTSPWQCQVTQFVREEGHQLDVSGFYGLSAVDELTPAHVDAMVELRVRAVNMAGNGLRALPDNIGLEWISLENNQLTDLPASFADLKKLNWLALGTNKFNTVSGAILASLPNIATLRLCMNGMRELPAEIGQMKALKDLDVGGNDFTTMPESLGDLVNLTKFTCNNGKLTGLPKSFGNLSNLRTLSLKKNVPEVLAGVPGDVLLTGQKYGQAQTLVKHIAKVSFAHVSAGGEKK